VGWQACEHNEQLTALLAERRQRRRERQLALVRAFDPGGRADRSYARAAGRGDRLDGPTPHVREARDLTRSTCTSGSSGAERAAAVAAAGLALMPPKKCGPPQWSRQDWRHRGFTLLPQRRVTAPVAISAKIPPVPYFANEVLPHPVNQTVAGITTA